MNGLNDTQIARLKTAFNMALVVYHELNPVKTTCGHCGVAKHDASNLHLQKQMLGGAITRLEKVMKWNQKGIDRAHHNLEFTDM